MMTQKWISCFGVLAALHFQSGLALAQEPTLLPPGAPANSPIDPAALNAAPAFGDSGPVIKVPQSDIKVETSPDEGTIWIPKLRVVLVTSVSEQTEVTAQIMPSDDRFPPTLDERNRVVRNVTYTINRPSEKSVVLACDDVNVEVMSGENSELTYSFSCTGKAMLTFQGYTVTGDSISSSEGKLSIVNAVIKSDQVVMTSEKLDLQLPVIGMQMEKFNPSEGLKPMPDPIGGAARKPESARKESEFIDDAPFQRGDPLPTPPQDRPFSR